MKKLLIGGALLLGALAFAGQASAATIQENIWGASAQYQMYKDTITALIQSQPGCSSATVSTNGDQKDDTGKSTYFTATCGGNTYIYDLNAKASYDGVLALQGQAHPEDKTNSDENFIFCDPTTFSASNLSCEPGTPNDHCNYAYRIMSDPNATVSETFPCSTIQCTGGTITYKVACNQIDIALSDVNPSSFTQATPASGQIPVPNGRSFPAYFPNGVPIPPNSNTYNPMVVPFGFFVHNDVKLSTCTAGGTATTNVIGQQCSQNSDCDAGNTGSGVCTAAQLTNITRMQILQMMSAQAVYWTDFGAGYNSTASTNGNEITVCARVAGSGTHATLDYAILRQNSNGATGPGGYHIASFAPNLTVYSDSTTPLMYCINNNAGAIGYADADQALSTPALGSTTYPNVVPMKYEGQEPSRRSIRNGQYDNYYSREWVFESQVTPDYTNGHSIWVSYMNQLSNATGITSTSRKYFWASLCEMVYMKAFDYNYPVWVGGADNGGELTPCLQTP